MSGQRIVDPGRFLADSGLLFEINRTLLHPLGLALEVSIADDGTSTISGLQDHSNDPEGMIFSPESLADGENKLAAFMAAAKQRHETRLSALGFVVQR